jgi:hypothetical protein
MGDAVEKARTVTLRDDRRGVIGGQQHACSEKHRPQTRQKPGRAAPIFAATKMSTHRNSLAI